MQEFFTWAMLASYVGAVAATTLLTQLFKGTGVLKKLPTQVFSYFVALVVLLLAVWFTDGLSLSNGILSMVNAAVVSLASNGAFEAVRQ